MFRNISRFLVTVLAGLAISLSSTADSLKVVLYDGGSPPLFFAKGDSNTGIYVDLLNEIGRVAGHKFEFHYYPTKRAMVLFEEGSVDLEVGINPAWRSSSKVPGDYSVPFGQSEDVVVFQKGKVKPVSSAADLAGAKVGTIKGFYYAGYMDAFAGRKIHRQDSLDEDKLMQKMAGGRLNAAFIRKEAAQYRIKVDNKFKALVIGDVIGSADIMLRVHPSKSSIMDSLNSAIKTLKESGKIDEIYSQYR